MKAGSMMRTFTSNGPSHATNNAYYLGRATELQATFLYQQDRFEEARSDALCAADIYEKVGAAKDVGDCRELLRMIDEETNNGEFLETTLLPMGINFLP